MSTQTRSRLTLPALTALALLTLPAVPPVTAQPGNELLLPELGDSASGVASRQEEYDLGQTWLRMFRAKVPESKDELLYDYVDRTLRHVAEHSAMANQPLSLVIVDNPTMNAFAVPGGVVGVHDGLFLYAGSEDEFAGVLAHELAHLSQRHFVRSVEKARAASIPTMAGLLAGLALMGTSGNAGMAAVMATQAANLESRLRFSRENEAEADRIGMETLVGADMDPQAIPAMFERMQRANRYAGDRPPEFLLTHPVTEKRIADSRNRAEQYPLRQHVDNPEYALMRARAILSQAENPSVAAKRFQSEMNGQDLSPEASRYGLALAQTEMRQFDNAARTLQPLLASQPSNVPFLLAQADILAGQQQHDKAFALVQGILKRDPGNFPATMTGARILDGQRAYSKATSLLETLLPEHAGSPQLWYQLAELRGQAGNIGGVHTARAEYFMLKGNFDEARRQLTYALKLYERDNMQSARVKLRLRELSDMEALSLRL